MEVKPPRWVDAKKISIKLEKKSVGYSNIHRATVKLYNDSVVVEEAGARTLMNTLGHLLIALTLQEERTVDNVNV